MVITQEQAEQLLAVDLQKYENAVQNYVAFPLNQNQFDALVSFAYNCGIGNLKKLVSGRDALQIAAALPHYNKAGGKVLSGLTKRRNAELELFLKSAPVNGNPYPEPTKNVRLNSKGNDVRWLQYALNSKGSYKLIVDGIAGNLTIGALMDWQRKNGLDPDGICGPLTRQTLLS
jgi:hypothetical protein